MSTDPATNSSPEPCRLLDVPAEIRNVIFGMVAEARKSDGSAYVLTTKQYHFVRRKLLGASLVNRQLSDELLKRFYGTNRFQFEADEYYLNKETTSGGVLARSGMRPVHAESLALMDPTSVLVKYGQHYDDLLTEYRSFNKSACVIELPPFRLRPMILDLVLSLPVPGPITVPLERGPGESGYVEDRRSTWVSYDNVPVEIYDWLYPLRELRAFGFTAVKTLKVELRFLARNGVKRTTLEERCKERLAEFNFDSEVELTVEGVACEQLLKRG